MHLKVFVKFDIAGDFVSDVISIHFGWGEYLRRFNMLSPQCYIWAQSHLIDQTICLCLLLMLLKLLFVQPIKSPMISVISLLTKSVH